MCIDEIEDEAHALFSCQAYEEFRREMPWFDGLHTAAVTDISNVVSADDEMSIRELSRFFVQSFAKKKRHCYFQSST